ncbi:hypothetical protein PSEUDO8Z_10621 [Pseudomonas sp. 8Z]|nr:hypothetical protein PSEUDO8Z_10621 [Pseudomonas sp. 8Z]
MFGEKMYEVWNLFLPRSLFGKDNNQLMIPGGAS